MFTTWSEKLVGKLSNKAYRTAYVREHVKTWIAYQIRALREQRGWLQGKLAEETGKPQSAISRIEDPDYGKLTLQTLFDVAAAFDLALVVKFVDYRTFLQQSRDVSPEDMRVDSFDPASLKPIRVPQGGIRRFKIHTWFGGGAGESAVQATPQQQSEPILVRRTGSYGVYALSDASEFMTEADRSETTVIVRPVKSTLVKGDYHVWQ